MIVVTLVMAIAERLAPSVGAKFAKPLAWLLLAIAIAGIAFGGWQLLKNSIIDDHETAGRADAAEQQLGRQEAGDETDNALEDRDDENIDDLQEGARDAANSDPEGARAPVGPVSRSVHDRLREQRNRKQP